MYIAALDIGGTKTIAAILNENLLLLFGQRYYYWRRERHGLKDSQGGI